MTTPAVNINSIDTLSGYTRYYKDRILVDSTGPYISHSKGVMQSRPESVSHPKDRSGWRAPGDWSHSGSQYGFSSPPSIVNTLRPGEDYIVYEDAVGVPLERYGLQAVPQSMEDTAVNQALKNLKNQAVNYGVAFFELGETTDLLLNTVGKITRSVKTYRANNPKDWLKVLRSPSREGYDVPGGWLELQYGWNPLLSDVGKAINQMHDKSVDLNAYNATVRGRARNTVRETFYKANGYTGAGPGLPCWICPMVTKQEVRVRLDYYMSGPILATLSSLGLTNPLEIVWEKLPYSFVVDWVVPVGNYLSLWDADYGWTFKGGSITTIARCEGRSGAMTSGYGYSERSGCTWGENSFSMRRQTLNSSPWPRVPNIKNPFTAGHIANAMSLLVNCFRK